MSGLREKYDLKPLVIHANYLINLAGGNEEFRRKSIAAFRGELERGAALCADYLVLHPGSFRGASRVGKSAWLVLRARSKRRHGEWIWEPWLF